MNRQPIIDLARQERGALQLSVSALEEEFSSHSHLSEPGYSGIRDKWQASRSLVRCRPSCGSQIYPPFPTGEISALEFIIAEERSCNCVLLTAGSHDLLIALGAIVLTPRVMADSTQERVGLASRSAIQLS